LLLGAAGFLRGKRATTHPSALKGLEPYCQSVVRERVVDDGDTITAGGVSSAIDAGLHLVQRLAGPDARARVAAQMDYPYRWNA
jgi:cyclohexyl-isocyanide hydratase